MISFSHILGTAGVCVFLCGGVHEHKKFKGLNEKLLYHPDLSIRVSHFTILRSHILGSHLITYKLRSRNDAKCLYTDIPLTPSNGHLQISQLIVNI
jgi:hypothetical protein